MRAMGAAAVLPLAAIIAVCCCCSTASAATAPTTAFGRARQQAADILAEQQNTLLKSVTAKPSPPAPQQTAAANQRIAATAATNLQSGPFCGDGNCDAGENCTSCAQDCFQLSGGQPTTTRCKRIGIMYSVWHWPAVRAIEIQRDARRAPVTVEDVIRSRRETPTGLAAGARVLNDVVNSPGVAGPAMDFHYQYQPKDGFYCIYRKRQPGTLNYNVKNEGVYQTYTSQPDCANIVATLTRHAQQLTAAGIDFVVVDATNIPDYNPTSDAIQLRPFEVLCEVWSDLRSKGIKTPEIAIWQRVPTPTNPFNAANRGRAIYPYALNVYNDPRFQQVIMKDSSSATRRKLFFIPRADSFDEAYTKDIQTNGNRNDIAAVYLWVNRETFNGWNFMSFCTGLANVSASPCNQPYTASTTGSGIPIGTTGSQMAVSPAYQTTYHSLTQQGCGNWEGLTFQKQFSKVFSVKPDYLFLSTFNEHIAQPQGNFPKVPPGYSMGLESDTTGFNRSFVDVYGSAFGRDIEPSKEDGSLLYDIMASCIKIYRSGSIGCGAANNRDAPCCLGSSFGTRFKYVTTNDGVLGIRAATFANTLPLYQCTRPPTMGRRLQQTSPWFYSTSGTCEGTGYTTGNTVIGYIPTVRGGNFLRALRRCRNNSNGDRTKYILNGASCGTGFTVDAVLGYVR